mgnify:CR=1 FL=1
MATSKPDPESVRRALAAAALANLRELRANGTLTVAQEPILASLEVQSGQPAADDASERVWAFLERDELGQTDDFAHYRAHRIRKLIAGAEERETGVEEPEPDCERCRRGLDVTYFRGHTT